MNRIQRALISVTDKTGIVDFASDLSSMGVEILSTGGTAKAIGSGGVPVTEVADFTGFPEMLDGRVKTLHPKIHSRHPFSPGSIGSYQADVPSSSGADRSGLRQPVCL